MCASSEPCCIWLGPPPTVRDAPTHALRGWRRSARRKVKKRRRDVRPRDVPPPQLTAVIWPGPHCHPWRQASSSADAASSNSIVELFASSCFHLVSYSLLSWLLSFPLISFPRLVFLLSSVTCSLPFLPLFLPRYLSRSLSRSSCLPLPLLAISLSHFFSLSSRLLSICEHRTAWDKHVRSLCRAQGPPLSRAFPALSNRVGFPSGNVFTDMSLFAGAVLNH